MKPFKYFSAFVISILYEVLNLKLVCEYKDHLKSTDYWVKFTVELK